MSTPGPGLEEYAAKAVHVTDHPDDTGGAHMVESWRIACREHRNAQERGVLTWRLILRRDYRRAMATRDPRQLATFLRVVAATAGEWAAAIDTREARP